MQVQLSNSRPVNADAPSEQHYGTYRATSMDIHQAYCLNFLALTKHWGRGWLPITAAWALSVLGITLTAAAAWLLGERLAIGPVPLDLQELAWFEFWFALVVGVVNDIRFFRFFRGAGAVDLTAELLTRGSGRTLFAVAALLGPAAIVLIIVAIDPSR